MAIQPEGGTAEPGAQDQAPVVAVGFLSPTGRTSAQENSAIGGSSRAIWASVWTRSWSA